MSARARSIGSLIALAAAFAAPLVITSGRWLEFLELTLFVALLGQSWNILGGYGGQYSFGHALFFGTGAYVQAMLQFRYGISPWVALPFAVGLGAGVGAFVGFLNFRYGLRGSYFALITLAFAEAFHVLARSLVAVTEGGRGIQLHLNQDPALALAGFQFTFAGPFLRHSGYYYTILVFFCVACALVWRMEQTRFGAQPISVRDNIAAAAHTRLAARSTALAKAEEVAAALGMSGLLDQLAGALPIAGRKRLEIARALATDPVLLLLDEVMAGLNPAEIAELAPMIRRVRDQGTTILMIEHVMQAVMNLSDRAIVLNNGAIIASGTPGEIVGNPAVIEAYLGAGMARRLARTGTGAGHA